MRQQAQTGQQGAPHTLLYKTDNKTQKAAYWSCTVRELPSGPVQPFCVLVLHCSLRCLPFASEPWNPAPWFWLCRTMRQGSGASVAMLQQDDICSLPSKLLHRLFLLKNASQACGHKKTNSLHVHCGFDVSWHDFPVVGKCISLWRAATDDYFLHFPSRYTSVSSEFMRGGILLSFYCSTDAAHSFYSLSPAFEPWRCHPKPVAQINLLLLKKQTSKAADTTNPKMHCNSCKEKLDIVFFFLFCFF